MCSGCTADPVGAVAPLVLNVASTIKLNKLKDLFNFCE